MEKIKVGLVNPSNSYAGMGRSFRPPLGLMALSSLLAERCDLRVFDANVIQTTPTKIAQKIKLSSDLVCLSAWLDNYPSTLEIIKHCKQQKADLPIVVGGPFATVAPDLYLRAGADIVVLGEGRDAIWEIVERLICQFSLVGVPGTVSLKKDGLVFFKRKPSTAILELRPTPFELFPMESYFDVSREALLQSKGRCMQIVTRLGCNHACDFCGHKYIQARLPLGWQRAETDVKRLVSEYQVESFYVMDADFSEDEGWAKKLCGLFKEIKAQWLCDARADTTTAQLLAVMAESGCREVWVGLETASNRQRATNHKGASLEVYERMIKAARMVGIKPVMFVLFGLPGETEETINSTMKFLDKHQLAACANVLYPIPGTRIWKLAKKKDPELRPEDIPRYIEKYNQSGRLWVEPNLTVLPDQVIIDAVAAIRRRNQGK